MTTDIDAPPTCPLAIDTPYGRMWHMAGSLLDGQPRYTLTAGGGPNDAPVGEPMTLDKALERSISDGDDMLKSPFPYFGGKSRIASAVWLRLGDGRGRDNAAREVIWFSPHCLKAQQRSLFDEVAP